MFFGYSCRRPASIGVGWRGGPPACRTPRKALDARGEKPRGAGGLTRTQSHGTIGLGTPCVPLLLAKLALFAGRARIAGRCGFLRSTRMAGAVRLLGRTRITCSLLGGATRILNFCPARTTGRARGLSSGGQSQRKSHRGAEQSLCKSAHNIVSGYVESGTIDCLFGLKRRWLQARMEIPG